MAHGLPGEEADWAYRVEHEGVAPLEEASAYDWQSGMKELQIRDHTLSRRVAYRAGQLAIKSLARLRPLWDDFAATMMSLHGGQYDNSTRKYD